MPFIQQILVVEPYHQIPSVCSKVWKKKKTCGRLERIFFISLSNPSCGRFKKWPNLTYNEIIFININYKLLVSPLVFRLCWR